MGNAEGGARGTDGELDAPLFFVDGDVSNWEPYGVYVRATESIVGDEDRHDPISLDLGISRCFNCGSPDHIVTSCPTPLDRPLVSLSRQLFNFIQASRGTTDFQRIHVVEQWRQQRLDWLDVFEPGEIRGLLLRDALGSDGDEWLKNMTIWGYPKGWVGVTDPREHVRELIINEYADGVEDPEPFVIFGDGHEVEIVYSNGSDSDRRVHDCDSDSDTTCSSTAESSSDFEADDTTPSKPIRWAEYPPTHFASHLLPIYTGIPLPPISHRGSATYTSDRQHLWHRIISGQQSSGPPWRISGADEAGTYASETRARNSCPTPPPTTEPPPLPPSPYHTSLFSAHSNSPERDDCAGSDMDMSDS
jgi:zinc finger CCHC domain-containing protein 8